MIERLLAAAIAMLAHEMPRADQRAEVERRSRAVVEACEAAAPSDGVMAALCVINAHRESRMDPNVCDRERDPDGRPNCDRACLRNGRIVRDARIAAMCRCDGCHLGPPRAEGTWQMQRWTLARFGAACGARTLRDLRDLDAGAYMFVASVRAWRERTQTWEAAMSSHMVGHLRAAGRKGTARVRWARRWAP